MLNVIKKSFFLLKIIFKRAILVLKSKSKKYTHLYIGTPTHGNLGDQQIRVSTIEMLKDLNIKFIEINIAEFYYLQDIAFKNIKTILLHGGGNIGDEYLYDAMIRDHVIRKYQDKKIIIFPQTIFYKDINGSELKITKSVFETHPNLTLDLREKTSYEFAKNNFKVKSILTPDIVMYSNYSKALKRKNVLMLLRHDVEKTTKQQDIDSIISSFKEMGKKVTLSDTCVSNKRETTKRKHQLKRLFKKISSAEIVVTDRLHGMIFCAITNTPCIVLSNYNHKIKDSYLWLKNLDYIHFEENVEEINIQKLTQKLTHGKSKWKPLRHEFEKLINGIKENNENR